MAQEDVRALQEWGLVHEVLSAKPDALDQVLDLPVGSDRVPSQCEATKYRFRCCN